MTNTAKTETHGSNPAVKTASQVKHGVINFYHSGSEQYDADEMKNVVIVYDSMNGNAIFDLYDPDLYDEDGERCKPDYQLAIVINDGYVESIDDGLLGADHVIQRDNINLPFMTSHNGAVFIRTVKPGDKLFAPITAEEAEQADIYLEKDAAEERAYQARQEAQAA